MVLFTAATRLIAIEARQHVSAAGHAADGMATVKIASQRMRK